jgi:hypothetical protein
MEDNMNHMTKTGLERLTTDNWDDYAFPIETVPIKANVDDDPSGDLPIPDRVALIRSDTNEYLATHSLQYKPVKHEDIVNPVMDILDRISKDYHVNIRMHDNGALMVAKFTCKDILIEDPSLNDYIAYQITLRNSYNGMWSVMINAYGLRMFCMNECTTPDKIANFKLKHNGIFNYNFEHLEHSINLFRDNEPRFREWYKTPVQETDAMKLFNKLTYTPKPTVDGRYRNETQFANLWKLWNNYRQDIGSNKWGLYNAVTHWISHPTEVSRPERTQVERNTAFTKYLQHNNNIFIDTQEVINV